MLEFEQYLKSLFSNLEDFDEANLSDDLIRELDDKFMVRLASFIQLTDFEQVVLEWLNEVKAQRGING